MVFVYPGGYSWGYTNTSFYGPDFFMEEDVVLVSINHRLGPLGSPSFARCARIMWGAWGEIVHGSFTAKSNKILTSIENKIF